MHSLRRFAPPVLAQLFWATNFIFGSRLIQEFTPLELTTYRWLGALPLLLLIAWWLERPDWRAAWREWGWHLLQALLGMVGYTLFLYAALETSSSVNAGVISAMSPATITIAAVILLGERVTRIGVAGIALSIVGVLLVVLAGQSGASGLAVSVGDLLLVASVVVWTAYVIVSRRLRTPPITATAVQVALSVAVLLPVLAIVGAPAEPTAAGWFGLAWIIVFPSALAYLLWNIAAATLGPAKTGVFLNLLPVFTTIIALALGDVVTVWQIVGGVIVLVGVYLATRPPRVPADPPLVADGAAEPGATHTAPIEIVGHGHPATDARAEESRREE
ncbi:DMT family transporter [Microcella alkalica]|uniref:DMT family transporter n=1 Tax=Microcella alkalica TaxID=355930 RepID=UPI00145D38A0|nr:DMT family transporter [Microcella alkalica]